MLIKIKRQDCLNQYQVFPLRGYNHEKEEELYFYPKVFKSYILTIPSKTFKGHAKALGLELPRLAEALSADSLIFLGDTETPWLYQKNDYGPAIEAQQYLRDKKIGKGFNGALQVDKAELPTFTKHLARLIRCNAALPYFHFTNQEQNMVGSICQFGNLHLDTLDKPTDKTFKSFIESSNFEYGNIKSCNNGLGKRSAISGRKTIV